MSRLFRILLFIALPMALRAATDDPAPAFAQANRDFAAGDYAKAESAYRQLAAGDLVSPELFFNLGNATYRQDRPGEAALWYRRALALDPRFAEARQNLEFIRKRTGFHEFELHGIDAFFSRLGNGELIAILTAGAWLAILALAASMVVRRFRDYRPLLYSVALLAVASAVGAAWGLHRQRGLIHADSRAVVIANEASAVTGPVPDAAKVVDLPPGSELQIIQSAGPWTYVGIPQDIRGWVRTESIAPVLQTKT